MDLQLVGALLILLNPFSLFLYLKDVMERRPHRDFVRVLLKASLISYVLCLIFAFFGEDIFMNVIKINFESFRMFGGIVIFSFAFLFIVRGHKTLINAQNGVDEIAQELAMPFMVGAGVISISVLIGHNYNYFQSALQIGAGLAANLVIILLLKYLKDFISARVSKEGFERFMGIMVRVLGFMLGAIGIEMVITSIKNAFLC